MMMPTLLCLHRLALVMIAVLVGTVVAKAQSGAATGVVYDTSGRPVANAELTIVGQSGSVRTDAAGRFAWRPTPKPPFVLIIVLPGGQVAKPQEIDSLDALAKISVEAAFSEQVTVAAGVAPSIDAAPGNGTTMLSAEEIELRAPANLTQALENVPGVNQVSEGQAAVPAVRGLARGRTLILLDGSRVTSERRVGPSATFLDPAIIAGIDVSRGPGSVAYGSDALGGVISVRTERPSYSGLHASGAVTIGGGIPDRRAEGSVGQGFGSGGVLVSAHLRNAEDYRAPGGDVLNSGWSDSGFLARAEHRVGEGLFGVSWQSDFGRDIERPRSNSSQIRFYYPFENSHRLNASYERSDVAGVDLLRVSGFFGTIEQRTDQDRFATATRPRDIVRADVAAKDFQFRISGERSLKDVEVEVGADVNGRYGLEAHDINMLYNLAGEVISQSDNVSVASARRVDAGIYLQVESPLASWVSVKGGVRGDRVANVNADGYFGARALTNQAAAGFGSVSIRPAAHVTLAAQASRGFRDPMLSDRFFRGPTGRGYTTGNPDLEPETSGQFDVGARYTSGRVRLAAYGYYYRIHNLVERYSTTTDFFFFRNRGRARIRGVEVEGQVEAGYGITVESAAQVSRGTALDDGSALDDISPDEVSCLLRKAFGTRLTTFGRIAWFASDNRPGPSEIAAPGHTNVDVGASWVRSRIEVRGAVRNLLNQEYYASPDPRFVLAPGLNGFVTFAIRY